MTIQGTAIKALASYTTDVLLAYNKKTSQTATKKKTPNQSFLSHNQRKETPVNDWHQNFSAMIPEIKSNTTFCETDNRYAEPLPIVEMGGNHFDILSPFSEISSKQMTDNFITFLKNHFEKMPDAKLISLKIEDDFFSVNFEKMETTANLSLENKIYDISRDELKINNTEGICYKHKMNGKYVRLNHIAECPNISILKTGENKYIIFPSKHYLEKNNQNKSNTHSFKELILRNNKQDNELLSELFCVLSKVATKEKNIKIIDTQNTKDNSSFRVSIE